MLAAGAINAAAFTSVGTVGSTGGGNLLTVTNADKASTYSVTNENTGGGANNVSVGGISVGIRAAQVSGTSDAINFSASNAGIRTGSTATGLTVNNAALTSTATGIETINVATSGTNYLRVTGSTAAGTDSVTLNVTGNGNNTINATDLTNTTTFNMSTSTGTNVLNMTTNLQSLMSFTGGSGADTVQTSATGVVGALSMTGIETLRISTNAANLTATFATNPNLTTLRLDTDAGADLNTFVNLGFSNLHYVGAGTNATAAAAQGFDALTVTSGFAGAADTVNARFSNQGTTLAAGVGYGAGALSLTGVETLNIEAIDLTATGVVAIANITGTTLSAINVTTAGTVTLGTITSTTGVAPQGSLNSVNLSGVTGTGVSTLAIANNTTTAGTVITASTGGTNVTAVGANDATDTIVFTGGIGNDTFTGTGFAGILALTGGAGNDVLVGGSNVDTIIAGEGADRVTGGAGNDAISLTETVAAIDQVAFLDGGAVTIADYATANGSDTVTGFNTANDIVVFQQAVNSINGTQTIAFQAGATNTAIAVGTTVYEIAGSLGASGAAGLVANLGTAATNADLDLGDALVFIQYTAGNNMEVYYFVDADGANVTAAELTLVGTFSGITADAFAAGNIAAAFA